MLAAVIAVVVLLRDVLLPFVAGLVLAYLLDPVATRLERLGINRLIATLIIIGLFVAGVAVLIVRDAPIIVSELAYLVDTGSAYARRLQAVATDPGRPWLSKIVGEGLGHAERSVGELTTLAPAGSKRSCVRSGPAAEQLISVFSLAVVTPIVAAYLIYDWNRHDRGGRQLGAAGAPRHRAGAGARGRRDDRRLRARPERAVSRPRRVLRRGDVVGRIEPRCPDRHHRGPDQLHPLSRCVDRPRGLDRRRDRAVLAELDLDPARAGDLLRRPGRWPTMCSRPIWSAGACV